MTDTDTKTNTKKTDATKHTTVVTATTTTITEPVPHTLALPPQRKLLVLGVLAVVLIIGGFFGLRALGVPNLSANETVASVNGATITRGAFDKRMAQVKVALVTQKGPMDAAAESALRRDVLNEMVDSKLLLQEAAKTGVAVSDADVAQEFTRLTSQFANKQALSDQLAAVGMSEGELKQNIRNEKIIQTYLEANTDIKNITASEVDIQKVYDEQVAGKGATTTLAQVHDMLQQQIIQQKTSDIVKAYVAGLRAKADIKILL